MNAFDEQNKHKITLSNQGAVMNAHTPTPWQVIPKNDHGNINYKIANKSYTWIIAEMKADTDIDTQENNAKFIVKAVNMHEELVEALLWANDYIELTIKLDGSESIDAESTQLTFDKIKQALSKLKGA